jgi:hypothetical protein
MNGEGIDIYKDRSSGNKIRSVLMDLKMYGYSKRKPFTIGRVEKRMMDYAKRNGIELGSKSIYMSVKSLTHSQRPNKQSKKLSVDDYELINFPKARKRMKLYFDNNTDKKKRNFVYVSNTSKFIIHPNYEIKFKNGKTKVVNFITAQRLNKNERFDDGRFEKI